MSLVCSSWLRDVSQLLMGESRDSETPKKRGVKLKRQSRTYLNFVLWKRTLGLSSSGTRVNYEALFKDFLGTFDVTEDVDRNIYRH